MLNSPTPPKTTTAWSRWHTVFAIVGAVVTLGALYVGWLYVQHYKPIDPVWRKDRSLQGRGGVKGPYLEVYWPEKQILNGVRPAVTLRVPRDYVHAGTTYLDDQGNIRKVAVCFGLPGARPLEMSRARDSFVERHCMDITPGGLGYGQRMSFRPRDCSNEKHGRNCMGTYPTPPRYDSYRVPDAPIGGLERYSTVYCYRGDDIKKPEAQKYFTDKPLDDKSPPGCRMFRKSTMLVSPPEVKADDEGVAIDCIAGSCWAYFTVADISVRMRIKYENLSQWQEFIEPARQLARTFVMQDGPRVTSRPQN